MYFGKNILNPPCACMEMFLKLLVRWCDSPYMRAFIIPNFLLNFVATTGSQRGCQANRRTARVWTLIALVANCELSTKVPGNIRYRFPFFCYSHSYVLQSMFCITVLIRFSFKRRVRTSSSFLWLLWVRLLSSKFIMVIKIPPLLRR